VRRRKNCSRIPIDSSSRLSNPSKDPTDPRLYIRARMVRLPSAVAASAPSSQRNIGLTRGTTTTNASWPHQTKNGRTGAAIVVVHVPPVRFWWPSRPSWSLYSTMMRHGPSSRRISSYTVSQKDDVLPAAQRNKENIVPCITDGREETILILAASVIINIIIKTKAISLEAASHQKISTRTTTTT
jgi:hypothetical protein